MFCFSSSIQNCHVFSSTIDNVGTKWAWSEGRGREEEGVEGKSEGGGDGGHWVSTTVVRVILRIPFFHNL